MFRGWKVTGRSMRAFLAFFVLQHAAASGACCASVPSAKVALVRAGTLHPFDLLLSDMSKKKGHLGRTTKRGQVSKADTQQPSQLAARDRRASLEPVAQLEPTVAPPEPDQAPADMVFTDECAPASAPRAEARACLEGTAWRRRRRLMLGKKDMQGRAWQDGRATSPSLCSLIHHEAQHNSAKFGVMILKSVRDPASGRSDSRALLLAHRGPPMTAAPRRTTPRPRREACLSACRVWSGFKIQQATLEPRGGTAQSGV
ncbi:hypothetical protein T492DRAFT_1124550 [Pavlovales sp. CCMP2436]|nr:hypothetical protein T492DRAFT_1124550 [Pavlovales sp. CCMP2436]